LILLEHPLSSYVQKVKIAPREKGVSQRNPHELGSGRAGGAFKAANPRIEVPLLIDGPVRIFESTVIPRSHTITRLRKPTW
jgi:glutathione S-transferase